MDSETPTKETTTPPNDGGRAATMFVIKLVVLTLLLGFLEAYLHRIDWGHPYQEFVASVAGWIASLITDKVTCESNVVTASGYMLVVTLECTALFAKGLFCAAAIAFPASWRARLIGCAVGIGGVAVLNIIRIVGLAWITIWIPRLFHFAHLVLMQWFLISCVAPLWLAWAVWTTRRARRIDV